MFASDVDVDVLRCWLHQSQCPRAVSRRRDQGDEHMARASLITNPRREKAMAIQYLKHGRSADDSSQDAAKSLTALEAGGSLQVELSVDKMTIAIVRATPGVNHEQKVKRSR
jgi:hypothetical protein